MRRTPSWNNYIMRKHGQSIRAEIARAYGSFARAVAVVRREERLDRLLEEIPEEMWRAA